jgi:hypothetical protein
MQVSNVSQYVASWFKYSYLSELLVSTNISMVYLEALIALIKYRRHLSPISDISLTLARLWTSRSKT